MALISSSKDVRVHYYKNMSFANSSSLSGRAVSSTDWKEEQDLSTNYTDFHELASGLPGFSVQNSRRFVSLGEIFNVSLLFFKPDT